MINFVDAISIVIPMKNEESTIAELLNSIASQSTKPSEVIIVDGGSTDRSLEIAYSFKGRIEALRIYETSGAFPGIGRNIGVDLSNSPWIAFTDCGVVLSEEWLHGFVKLIQGESNFDILRGESKPMVASSTSAAIYCVSNRGRNDVSGNIKYGSFVSVAVARDCWRRIGGMSNLRAGEDLEFWEKANELNCSIAESNSSVAYWRPPETYVEQFKKTLLYSTSNWTSGRRKQWHYGLLRQYLLIGILSVFARGLRLKKSSICSGWIISRAATYWKRNREDLENFNYNFAVLLGKIVFAILVNDLGVILGVFKKYTDDGRQLLGGKRL